MAYWGVALCLVPQAWRVLLASARACGRHASSRCAPFVTGPGGSPVLGATVHIVDDDASFRTALERRLRRAGYEVATYPTAQHLLNDLPVESGLGCINLDVRMPGLSGPELQTRLVERNSTLPILFMTGHPDVPTVVRTMKAG